LLTLPLGLASWLVEEKMADVMYDLPLLSTVVNTETNGCTTQVALAEVKVNVMVLGTAEGFPTEVVLVPPFTFRLDVLILMVRSARER
jgi:hypothetical protein